MPKEFSRTHRVSELVQRELADIIPRAIHASGLGMLTVSGVDVSPDLKNARVYITILGGTWTVAQTIKRLNDAAGFLRHQLAQRLTIRTTPELHFFYDESVEYGTRLSALINSVTPSSHEDSTNSPIKSDPPIS